MTVEQLIHELRRLPSEAEVALPERTDYHGDTYFEPISGGNIGIDGLLSFVEGNGRGALHLVHL
jgi:hypothetical protein